MQGFPIRSFVVLDALFGLPSCKVDLDALVGALYERWFWGLFHHPLPLENDLSSNPMLFLQLGGWLWLDGVHHLLLLESHYST